MPSQSAIRDACRALVPPILLASPSGWRHVYDGEDPDVTAKRAALIEQWVKVVLDPLVKLREGLDALQHSASSSAGLEHANLTIEDRALIAASAARFVCPRKAAKAVKLNLEGCSRDERDIWISPESTLLARGILSHPLLVSRIDPQEGDLTLDLEVVDYLLRNYIKPLFSATSSSSISQTTGRAAAPIANLVDSTSRRSAPLDDEVMWKGGDVKTASKVQVLGEAVLSDDENHFSDLGPCHQALGCTGVLYVCCLAIRQATLFAVGKGSSVDYWSRYWPLVLPPLLQLMEDPSPRFRLLGTCILSRGMLGPDTTVQDNEIKRRYDRQISTLLLRTGVSGVFASALDANLTHISHHLAGALFQVTAEAWIRLTSLTTDAMYDATEGSSIVPQSLPNVCKDRGRARYERLCKLLDDGVLRTWAYAQGGVRVDDFLDPSDTSHEDFIESKHGTGGSKDQQTEEGDVIDATLVVLAKLASPNLLGLGIVRYLDVCLEYLLQQLAAGLEVKTQRWKEKTAGNAIKGQAVPRLMLHREQCAAAAIEALVASSRPCPALKAWVARCLTVAAKCKIMFEDVYNATKRGSEQQSIKAIMVHLDAMLTILSQAQNSSFTSISKRIASLSGVDLAEQQSQALHVEG